MRNDGVTSDTYIAGHASRALAAVLRGVTAAASALGVIGCALLVTTLVVIPRTAHASNGQCIWEGGPGAPTYPSCVNEDCMGQGGMVDCTDPVIRPPSQYNDGQVDGEKFAYTYDYNSDFSPAVFCLGLGGTWNGFYGNPACANLPSGYNGERGANSESLALAGVQDGMNQAFGNGLYNPVTGTGGCGGGSLVSDTGWGQNTSYENGQIISDNRVMTYTAANPQCVTEGQIAVYVGKTRELQCDQSNLSRRLPNGDLQCFRPHCATCGDPGMPPSPVTGAQAQSQTDYQSGGGVGGDGSEDGGGGLTFRRYYNSSGSFHAPGGGPFVTEPSDFWQFSYQRHLTPLSNLTNASAVIHREDGTVEWFDGSGNEVLNVNGAADRLSSNANGGWTVTLANRDVEQYDANGNLTSVTTRSGIVTTISYGSNGLMSQISDSFGHTLTVGYNSNNQLTTVTLPDGISTINYGYGSLGQLTTVTNADQTTQTYAYEDGHNSWLMTGITDESSQRFVSYAFSGSMLVGQQQAGGAGTYSFNLGNPTYNNSVVGYATDSIGQQRTYLHVNANGVYKISGVGPYCDGCANLDSATYDAAGNLSSTADLNNYKTTYTYDDTRNLELSRTEGLSVGWQVTANTRTTTTQWHPTFRLPALISVYSGASATGTPLRTTSYTYDGYGNVLTKTITDPASGSSRTWTNTYYNSGLYGQLQTRNGPRTDVADVTSYTYYNCASGGQCGHVHTVTDALGHTTTYNSYDAHGYPTSITDPNGTVTTLTYDSRQRLTSRTVGGELTRYNYYPTGFLQKVTQPDGRSLSYLYDASHRLTEIDDAAGDRVVYTLDGAGHRIGEQRFDPSGNLARMQTSVYNSVGQMWEQLTSTGTLSQATVYGYDGYGNAVSVQAPLSRTTSNGYDFLNRLAQTTDPAGSNTVFGYDALDDLVSVSDPRNLTTSYTYNGLGDLTKLQSPDTGTTQTSFDSGGNLSVRTDARGIAANYSYDALNRVTRITYPDQTIGYTYDQGANALGRLSGFTDASGQTSYSYDTLGHVVGKQQVAGGVTLTVGYAFQNEQLTSLTTPSGQAVSYSYDVSGRLAGVSVNSITVLNGVQYSPFGPVSGWSWGNGTQSSRSYDVDGRLFQIQSAGTSTYTFLDDGTISSRSDDADHDYSVVPGSTSFAVNNTSNQLTGATGVQPVTYSYDLAGNTLGNGTLTFSYNGAGRMIAASQGTTTTAFAINALGQRVSKSSTGGATLFAYDEQGHLIGEYTGTGALIEETLWMGDTPVATLRPNSAGSVDIYYVHTDHLNAPRRVTRPTDNTIVWLWNSDPYGLGFVDGDPDGDGQAFTYNLRFPGQYADTETGLNYNYFRDYDPTTGRYVESDPIGLSAGVNTYAYVDDAPTMEYDLDGLDPEDSRKGHRVRHRHSPPPSNVPTDVKELLCRVIKNCNGDMDCVYKKLNFERRDPLWPGGPANPDGLNWNDPDLRQAENFATAAASNSAGYPHSWFAHNGPGIWIYQYFVKPYVDPAMNWPTTPVSDDAYRAGIAGSFFYNKPPSEVLKWCTKCGSQ